MSSMLDQKGTPTLNVGQVINLMIMDGDIMWCNRSPGAHEPPFQVPDLFVPRLQLLLWSRVRIWNFEC